MQIRSPTLILSLALIVAFWVGIPIAVSLLLPDWSTRGQFGDVFGVVNALFSGLAFGGVIVAILLQREDLALQREELKLTREELARSAQAQVQSEAALRAQAESARRSSNLATVNFLLDYYQGQLDNTMVGAYTQNDPRLQKFQELNDKVSTLRSIVEDLYMEVTTLEQQDKAQHR